jgi:hypothetical protein
MWKQTIRNEQIRIKPDSGRGLRSSKMILIIVGFLVMWPVYYSCVNADDPGSTRLTRVEETDNSGKVYGWVYAYDQQGRIISISGHEQSGQPVQKVSIAYSGKEVVVQRDPDDDPAFDQRLKVVLTLDGQGLTQKRIASLYKVPKTSGVPPSEKFVFDTLYFFYDAQGLLIRTQGSRYDSTGFATGNQEIRKTTYGAEYQNESGNLASSDGRYVYSVERKNGGQVARIGGSSRIQSRYAYAKQDPNLEDFSNSAVRNELRHHFEPLLNARYRNKPEQVTITYTERDGNDQVFFDLTTAIQFNRSYNSGGMLSGISIPANAEFREIRYFY